MRSLGCVVVLLLAGCPPARLDVECLSDADCELGGKGFCTPASTGKQWCAYPDGTCSPTGLRFSDYDVEDAVSGECVPHTPTLTVKLGGKGSGGVFSNPLGLTCAGDMCTGRFPAGTLVQMSAEAAEGAFLGWIDGCRGRGTCAVTMDDDRSVGALFGTPGEALWAQQLGSPESASGGKVVMDGDGNLIVVGAFKGTIEMGIGTGLRSNGGQDMFVVKLAAATGAVVWAKGFGGSMDESASELAVDGSGAIYISGRFQGTVDFGNEALQAEGVDAFVLKLDTSGALRWVRKIGGSGAAFGNGISTRGDAVVVAGQYTGSVTVDAQTFTAVNSEDFYVLKVTAETGTPVWFKSFGGNGVDWVNGAVVDSGGEIVLTGGFSGQANYGGGTMSTASVLAVEVFLLRLGSDGSHKVSRQFGPDFGSATGSAVAVDAANNIFITGDLTVSSGDLNADLGCGNTLHKGVFVAKYLQTGACVWAQGFAGNARGLAVALNASGELAVTGSFFGPISLGGQTVTSSGSSDIFSARFTNDGEHLSSGHAGGTGLDTGSGIAQDDDGRIYVSGGFSNRAEFAGEVLTSAGALDAFIVSHAPY